MLKPGDVVRVRESAVFGPESATVNKIWVVEHGWLWVVVEPRDSIPTGQWVCRSLATGYSGVDGMPTWFSEKELEQVNEAG